MRKDRYKVTTEEVEAFLATCDVIFDEFLANVESSFIDMHVTPQQMFEQFRIRLRAINLDALTKKEHKELRKRIFPLVLYYIREGYVMLMTNGKIWNSSTWSWLTHIFNDIQQLETAIMKRRANTVLAEIEQKVPAKPITTASKPALAATPSGFPALSQVNEQVDFQVSELRQQWLDAMKISVLTTEERFVLEQIAQVYLPDAWRIYEGLPDEASRSEAGDMLLVQLDSLKAQITEIIERSRVTGLDAMRAQTMFIQQKHPFRSGLAIEA